MLEITRDLTGDNCTHAYSCSWGLVHNCIGCCKFTANAVAQICKVISHPSAF